MIRLNSEDFSKFLLPLDIIFWANFYERTHKNLQKNQKLFRIFSNFFEFFHVFRSFSKFCFFVQQDAQSRATHQTIRHEILRRMDSVRS